MTFWLSLHIKRDCPLSAQGVPRVDYRPDLITVCGKPLFVSQLRNHSETGHLDAGCG